MYECLHGLTILSCLALTRAPVQADDAHPARDLPELLVDGAVPGDLVQVHGPVGGPRGQAVPGLVEGHGGEGGAADADGDHVRTAVAVEGQEVAVVGADGNWKQNRKVYTSSRSGTVTTVLLDIYFV